MTGAAKKGMGVVRYDRQDIIVTVTGSLARNRGQKRHGLVADKK